MSKAHLAFQELPARIPSVEIICTDANELQVHVNGHRQEIIDGISTQQRFSPSMPFADWVYTNPCPFNQFVTVPGSLVSIEALRNQHDQHDFDASADHNLWLGWVIVVVGIGLVLAQAMKALNRV